MLTVPTVSTPASRLRVIQGVAVPELPETRQEVLELVAAAGLPRGFAIDDSQGGLQLIRISDGARLGVMASMEVACRHASALAADELRRRAIEEDASR